MGCLFLFVMFLTFCFAARDDGLQSGNMYVGPTLVDNDDNDDYDDLNEVDGFLVERVKRLVLYVFYTLGVCR